MFKYSKVRKGTQKYTKVCKSTLKDAKVRRGMQEYTKVCKST